MARIPDWYVERAIRLRATIPLHTGEVHAQDTSGDPQFSTYELLNDTLEIKVPDDQAAWELDTQPNLPWAEEHFQERVSQRPYNPPPSHERWPFAQKNNKGHVDAYGKFSHTYPERFWPRHANVPPGAPAGHHGIRFGYGDLNDVVDLLVRNPLTRQAYLPVWFPEDIYAAWLQERVPCTIGYHFMIRNGALHCWYTMRSCDFVRYLRDDVYMAGRLMQWVVNEYETRAHHAHIECESQCGFVPPTVGTLHLTISSLHAFVGDRWLLDRVAKG